MLSTLRFWLGRLLAPPERPTRAPGRLRIEPVEPDNPEWEARVRRRYLDRAGHQAELHIFRAKLDAYLAEEPLPLAKLESLYRRHLLFRAAHGVTIGDDFEGWLERVRHARRRRLER